jgi:DNA-binding CsgD family transcriptional regulator/transcriptional regulator with GAF, ATPase, and Fis domain
MGNFVPQLRDNNNFENVRDRQDAATYEDSGWEQQIKMLSEIGDLITPLLSLQQVIALTYSHVNQLMDAHQFSVGLFDENELTITFKGIIENGKPIPDLVIDASIPDRLAPWCVLNNAEIFINDMEADYRNYVTRIPKSFDGFSPMAALYVPLRLHNKVVGLMAVRTIHKNVYRKHHLYVLKTLGIFVIRSLALAEHLPKPKTRKFSGEKCWQWCPMEQLPLTSRKSLQQLTKREKEVLFLMISGHSIREIAEELSLAPSTVKTHSLNLYGKMDVNNRTSAIMKAIESNWLI